MSCVIWAVLSDNTACLQASCVIFGRESESQTQSQTQSEHLETHWDRNPESTYVLGKVMSSVVFVLSVYKEEVGDIPISVISIF